MNKLLKQAFTLIELLVVIAIIGILSGLIVVAMSGVTQKANIAKIQVFSNSLKNSLMINLVSEYRLDGDVSDFWGSNEGSWSGSGGGTNLTANYRPSTECVYEQCLNFDGTDDYVDCGNGDSFKNITNAITVSYWVYVNAYPSVNYSWLVSKGQGSSAARSWSASMMTNGTGYFFFRSGDNSAYNYAGLWTKVPLKVWIHMVQVFDGSKTYAGTYQNGVIDVERSDVPFNSIYISNVNVQIGGGMATTTSYFNGLIDDVRIYNAAMSSSQIQEQYYAGLNSLLSNGNIDANEYSERINSIARQ